MPSHSIVEQKESYFSGKTGIMRTVKWETIEHRTILKKLYYNTFILLIIYLMLLHNKQVVIVLFYNCSIKPLYF